MRQEIRCCNCRRQWTNFTCIVVSIKKGPTLIEGTHGNCEFCKDKSGPHGVEMTESRDVDYFGGLLVVFGEHKIEGVPDFSDPTAICNRRSIYKWKGKRDER